MRLRLLLHQTIGTMIVLITISLVEVAASGKVSCGAFLPPQPSFFRQELLKRKQKKGMARLSMSYLDSLTSSSDEDDDSKENNTEKRMTSSYLDSINPNPLPTSPFQKSTEETKEGSISSKDEKKEENEKTDDNPNAVEVVQMVLMALSENDFPQANAGLTTTFDYSTDNCRAALGGSLDNFIAYANNPTFGFMIDCDEWNFENIGPIISGSATRGAMQTILVKIFASDKSKNFLFTMQKQRRPPRQNQWLVHECIFVDRAYELTT